MKKLSILLMSLIVLIEVGNNFSQEVVTTDSTQILSERIKTEGSQAILDAGDSGDKSLIPYLKKVASNSKNPWAQMALAKLGEEKYLNQILAEVDDGNPNVQDRAMRKLSYVGGEAAIKKFYELLDDTSPRENPEFKKYTQKSRGNNSESKDSNVIDVAVFWSRSSMAIYYLSQMVDNPPTRKGFSGREKDIPIWKEWFSKNMAWIQ